MILIIAITLIILDQLTKYIVVMNPDRLPIDLIKGVFSITPVLNTGGAFGLFKGYSFIFIGVSMICIVSILFIFLKNRAFFKLELSLVNTALALLMAGAAGNLIDRVRIGKVIDFIDFHVWPVFNLADCAITAGVLLMLINMFLTKRREV